MAGGSAPAPDYESGYLAVLSNYRTRLFLAIVLDVWSRRVVGWAMATHMRTELVLDALDMALARRKPRGVIHHSDQGCQYTSLAFGRRCELMGVLPVGEHPILPFWGHPDLRTDH